MSTDLFALLGDIGVQLKRIADALDIQVAPQCEKPEAERVEEEERKRLEALRRAESLKWDKFLRHLKATLPKKSVEFLSDFFSEAEVMDEGSLYDSSPSVADWWLAGETKKQKRFVRAWLAKLSSAAEKFFGKPLKFK
jgi:hypothetical protein